MYNKNVLVVGIFGCVMTSFLLVAGIFSLDNGMDGNIMYFLVVGLIFIISVFCVLYQAFIYCKYQNENTNPTDIENQLTENAPTETDPLVSKYPSEITQIQYPPEIKL